MILILLLIVFPKKSGYTAVSIGGYHGEKHSPCYGFDYNWKIPGSDSGSIEYCFGIPNFFRSYCKIPTSPYRENIRDIRDKQRTGELREGEAQERIQNVINKHEQDLRAFPKELKERLEKGEIDQKTASYLWEEKFSTTVINYTCGDERYASEMKYYEGNSWIHYLKFIL